MAHASAIRRDEYGVRVHSIARNLEETVMTEPNIVAATAPTVALVHGAFADSSGWSGVIAGLTAVGVRAQAVSNPLRGIASDAAYVASHSSRFPARSLPWATHTAVHHH
jgi:hypothetical protein